MKPHDLAISRSLTDWIKNLNDVELRSGHGLLNDIRVEGFSVWMDAQLPQLEWQFSQFMTHHSFRVSLGR